jgi:hypothetical protein
MINTITTLSVLFSRFRLRPVFCGPKDASKWQTLSLAAASRVRSLFNLQSRAHTHTVLVIGLYELQDNDKNIARPSKTSVCITTVMINTITTLSVLFSRFRLRPVFCGPKDASGPGLDILARLSL